MTALHPGDKVIVDPSDEDDPQAEDWARRECVVRYVKETTTGNLVRVVHGHDVAIFREKDLRKL